MKFSGDDALFTSEAAGKPPLDSPVPSLIPLSNTFQVLDELNLSDTPSLTGRTLQLVLPGFWTRCIDSGPYGCVANFLGGNMSTRVAASLKHQVCFGNITVLLEGPPGYELPRHPSASPGCRFL